jgi:hypothetical protein
MKSVQRQPLQSGSCVSFRLGDAICPGFGQIASQIGPDARVCGEVAFFSDRGRDKGHFAIITVEGVAAPLIVPVAKLEPFAARSIRTVTTQDDSPSSESRPDRLAPEASHPFEWPQDRREVG